MVFEDLVRPKFAKKHPLWLFFLGLLFSILAVIFGLFLFPNESSLVIVFLVVIMSMPFMYFTLKREEEEGLIIDSEVRLLKEHSLALGFLLYLFLGFVVGFSLFYIFLPQETVTQVFSSQLDTIQSINSNSVSTGFFLNHFSIIFANNLKVLFFTLLFAIFFGAGAIFILAWNASVISAAVGTYVRNALAESISVLGFTKLSLYFTLFVTGMLRYMVHGVFEIAAYFIAGLAGGIISMAIINNKVRLVKLKKVVKDACILVGIAIILLLLGAFVEVFITPLFF